MSSSPTVAVAGANGRLGKHVVTALISPNFKPNFGNVIALVRESTPQSTVDAWKTEGVEVRVYNEENMIEALKGVNTLINVLSSKGHHYKNAIAKAIPSTNISLYFPSEFGVDHVVHEFKQGFWDMKKDHYNEVRKLAPHVKVSRVYIGLFTEDSIAPWLGLDTNAGRYECVGSSDAKISFTTKEDSGKAMAVLASLPLSAIPEEVHIAGDTVSVNEIAKIMEARRSGPIAITSLELNEFKGKLMKEPSPSPAPYLRFLIADGKIDHRKEALGSDNELINEGGRIWKWKTVTDIVEEIPLSP